ncbi:hypothetical protein [Rhodopila sp.]|uniref:hypothetical protein n=1 Tax=Rhodopila sp. TaxID=2480087 RepID=UPI003D13FDFE
MTVDVAIPVEDSAALELQRDPLKRQALGELISDWLRPERRAGRLLAAMDRIAADARAKGLTEELVEAELAGHQAERQR